LLFGYNQFKKITAWANLQLKTLNDAETAVNDEIKKKQEKLDAEILHAQKKLLAIEKEIHDLENEETDLANELEQIKQKIEESNAATVLNEFVSERAGSDDYRKMLGVPALIHNDFKKLSSLINLYNRDREKDDKNSNKGNNRFYFNRIILYIDDLDRCPDERVVEVLQAVHLLLAFELFVVVVAVDSRWLNHALTKHYPALAYYQYNQENGNHNTQQNTSPPANADQENDKIHDNSKATSEDYLEKIFQIPFWIRPLGDQAKQNIVKGLMRRSLERKIIEQSGEQQRADLEFGEDQKTLLSHLDARLSPPALDTANLAMTQNELKMIEGLAPLMGDTPRAIKRFVNLYQLVRIVLGIPKLERYDPVELSDNIKLAFFLAIGDGLPKLTPVLMRHLMSSDNASSTLLSVLSTIDEPHLLFEKDIITQYLPTNAALNTATVAAMTKTMEVVERFLFRTGVSYHL